MFLIHIMYPNTQSVVCQVNRDLWWSMLASGIGIGLGVNLGKCDPDLGELGITIVNRGTCQPWHDLAYLLRGPREPNAPSCAKSCQLTCHLPDASALRSCSIFWNFHELMGKTPYQVPRVETLGRRRLKVGWEVLYPHHQENGNFLNVLLCPYCLKT